MTRSYDYDDDDDHHHMMIVTCVLHRIWLGRDQGKLGPSAPLQVEPSYDGRDDAHDNDMTISLKD